MAARNGNRHARSGTRCFVNPTGCPSLFSTTTTKKTSCHVVVKLKGVVAAYGRLHITRDVSYVSQMVVAPSFHRQGLGKLVLSALTALAREKGTPGVVLNARLSAVGFYTKARFGKVNGAFLSATTGVPM